ncbi:hypothetical protein BZJ19_16445 [Salinivibrio proteolyticus]|nr:hypothetical protein BZJ19_16445 [Salinivibrio proteolyticus]
MLEHSSSDFLSASISIDDKKNAEKNDRHLTFWLGYLRNKSDIKIMFLLVLYDFLMNKER